MSCHLCIFCSLCYKCILKLKDVYYIYLILLSGRNCVNGCPTLSVLHGVVTYNRSEVAGRYPPGTRGTYECDVSDTISGSGSRVCQRSGTWTGDPGLCRKSEKYLKLMIKMHLSSQQRFFSEITGFNWLKK